MNLIPRSFQSATARLAGLIFLLQLLATGGVLLAYRFQAQKALEHERREHIEAVRDDAMAAYYEDGLPGLLRFVPARLAERKDPELLLQVRRNGDVLAGNYYGEHGRASATSSRRWARGDVAMFGKSRPVTAEHIAIALPQGAVLGVGHVLEREPRIERAFEEGLIGAMASALLFAGLAALVSGRLISRRAGVIADTAQAIGRGDLSARVAEDGSRDGFDRLRHEMNAMAERIERVVAELRLVTDSLAHDLRTPVMRLKASAERLVSDANGDATARHVAAIGQEADTLLAMLTIALEISRMEAGALTDRRTTQALAPVVEEMIEMYRPYAEDEGVKLTLHIIPVTAKVDRELLSRALSNLIENAIKYGARQIDVEVATGHDDWLELRVRDNGPGIAPVDRAEAIRRFGRLDASRSMPGAGLGLALVDSIARFHGGALALEDNRPGLVAIIRLPHV